jgi:hypothetical protein
MRLQLEMIYCTKAVQAANNQCFVCETPITDGHWFAQVNHGNWNIHLCCRQCAQDFFAQRLPVLRRVGFQAALGSLAWVRPAKCAARNVGKENERYSSHDEGGTNPRSVQVRDKAG